MASKEFLYEYLLDMPLIREFPNDYLHLKFSHNNIKLLAEIKHLILQQIMDKSTA